MVEGDNFVFIHVPKTGGHAISTALGGRTPGPLHAKRRDVDVKGRFSFAFVRDPFDRAVSMWVYVCQKAMLQPSNIPEQDAARSLGFRYWLLNGDQRWNFRSQIACSQMEWLDGCDYIGRFERIATEFAGIVATMKIKAQPLQRMNTSDHADYRFYYDDHTAAFVARCAEPEINRFGYSL